jgi:hypothetical protein
MKIQRLFVVAICIGCALLLLGACGRTVATFTPVRPTLTPIPPMLTVIPREPTKAPAGPTTINTSMPPLEGRFEEFTGGVQIEGGQCCLGGVAGQTITARVQLAASSPFGKVDRMRVVPTGGCGQGGQLEAAGWEPFANTKTFPVSVAINWVGFYVSAQFQDEWGNLSPVYCDDISVEGMPAIPSVDPGWIPQVQCFGENEVHPAPGESVRGESVTFSWPDKMDLPEGVFYRVSAFSAADQYAATAAGGMTRETSITLPVRTGTTGDMVWYVTLVDEAGVLIDHGKCSSFPASLLTVDPPEGIKGVHFLYTP